MNVGIRLVLAIIVGLAAGGGLMFYDKSRGAEWVVSPSQIEDAKNSGKAGVETNPGSIAVLPIRSETADALPIKWAAIGLFGAFAAFYATRQRLLPDR